MLSAVAPAIAQDDAPRVYLTVRPTQVLSTGTASGFIQIDNTTYEEIGYSSLSVIFLIRDAAGHQSEDRWVKVISRIPTTVWIPAGRRQTFGVTLPKCDALIDPCTQRVAIKLELWTRRSVFITQVTNEVSYSFVPDPTATFRVDGLADDRPLFLTQGEAREAVARNRALIEIRFVGTVPSDLDSTVSGIAIARGLILSGSGSRRDAQLFWITLGDASAAPSTSAVDSITADIRDRYRDKAASVTSSFVPDDRLDETVFNQANGEAGLAAARLARFTGADPLSYAGGLVGDPVRIQFDPSDDASSAFFSYSDLLFDPAVKEREKSTTPAALDVLVRVIGESMGARSTTGPPADAVSPPPQSEYYADGSDIIDPMTVRATIEADRPQLFAIAATTREASERFGLDPEAVALVLARNRARALARQLGVVPGSISLVAQYRDKSWSNERTLVPFGVALTISNESDATWLRLKPSQPTPPQGVFVRAPPSPQPAPTVLRAPADFGVPTPELDPIDVPDAATSLTASGDVVARAVADEIRVWISIARGDRTPDDLKSGDLPDPTVIQAQILAIAGVTDAAVQATARDPLPIGYEIIASASAQPQIERVIDLLHERYERFHVDIGYGASPALSDCAGRLMQAQKLSVDQAEQRAVDQASVQRRRLRRLVLAAAYPPVTGDFCVAGARSDSLDRSLEDRFHMPDDLSLTIHVPVKLTFRTDKAIVQL